VVLGLTHEKGEARLEIVIQSGKLERFDLKGPRFAVSLPYRAVSAAEFVSFAWLGSQPPRIRFEGDGAARVLVLADGAGGEIRLRRDE
jgi:hypothetical protein